MDAMLILLTYLYVETGREANTADVQRDFMHICQPNISYDGTVFE